MRRRKPRGADSKPRSSDFPENGGDAYLMVAQGRLDHQMATLDALDTKVANQLVAAVAEAAFLLALLAIRPPSEHEPSLSTWILLAVAALTTVAVVAVSWAVLRVRGVMSYPSPDGAWLVAHGQEPVAWELARSLEEAHKANAPGQSKKAGLVAWSGYLLLGQTVFTTAAALTIVFT